jgi:hypothetical protein
LLIGSSGGARFDLQSLYVSADVASNGQAQAFTIATLQFKATRNGSPVGTSVERPNVVGSNGFQKVEFADFQDIDQVEVIYSGGYVSEEALCLVTS